MTTITDLINSHISLAEKIATIKKCTMPKCVSYDDLKSAAYFGLVDAANKYNPKKNSCFGIYAAWRIAGAIRDYLREISWGKRGNSKPAQMLEEISFHHVIPSELFEKLGGNLSEIARLIIGLYYREGHSQSEIADIKHLNEEGGAGTIIGGIFLKNFVGNTPWAHLDIASTSWAKMDSGICAKGSTGVPVRLLVEVLRNWKN